MVLPCKMFRNVGYIKWHACKTPSSLTWTNQTLGDSFKSIWSVLTNAIWFWTYLPCMGWFYISALHAVGKLAHNNCSDMIPWRVLKHTYPNIVDYVPSLTKYDSNGNIKKAILSEPRNWESEASRLRRLMKRSRESKHKKLTALKEAARACGWLTSKDDQPAFGFQLASVFPDPCYHRSSSKWCPIFWAKLFESNTFGWSRKIYHHISIGHGVFKNNSKLGRSPCIYIYVSPRHTYYRLRSRARAARIACRSCQLWHLLLRALGA